QMSLDRPENHGVGVLDRDAADFGCVDRGHAGWTLAHQLFRRLAARRCRSWGSTLRVRFCRYVIAGCGHRGVHGRTVAGAAWVLQRQCLVECPAVLGLAGQPIFPWWSQTWSASDQLRQRCRMPWCRASWPAKLSAIFAILIRQPCLV